MKRNVILVLAVSLGAMGLVAGLAYGSDDAKRHESFSYAGISRIVLTDTQGMVRVTAGGTGPVHVDRTSTTLFAKATDNARAAGGVLYLESHCNHTLCAVDYRIAVPAGVRLKIGGTNLDVAVTGAPGNVGVDSTGESKIALSLAKAVAVVAARTHQGEVSITVPRGSYAVTAHASGGNTTTTGVTVRRNAKHTISASTGSGNVTIIGR
jgi:hypothetical protein